MTIQELSVQVEELQVALDAEQKQVADAIAAKEAANAALQAVVAEKVKAIAGLEATVSDLEALVAEGGTPAERQAVADKLAAIKEDLETTV